jgi:non-ribosomal peptide synthetase component F
MRAFIPCTLEVAAETSFDGTQRDTKSSTFHAGESRTDHAIGLGQIECNGRSQIREYAMLELASLISRHARCRPDATAVVVEGERLTYRQVWARVVRVGNLLRSLGIVGATPGEQTGASKDYACRTELRNAGGVRCDAQWLS